MKQSSEPDSYQQHREEARYLRARAWRFIFSCYENHRAAGRSGGEDDAKGVKRRFGVVGHRETLPQFRRQVRELIVRIITSDASQERMAAMLKNVHKPSTWPAIREELDRWEEGGEGVR